MRVALLALLACATCGGESRVSSTETVDDYWLRPIPLQGQPPKSWTVLEQSLLPKDCGSCHRAQYEDWSGALHAKAMSPGLLGQLIHVKSPGFSRGCYKCHGPMVEQQPKLERAKGDWIDNEFYDPKLRASGVGCPVCHMRGSKIHGPPPRDDAVAVTTGLPHGGFVVSRRFQSSELCAACHQFPPDWPKLNGKLLENTFEEWKVSRAAREGKTCQSCHMPDRRHLFRGIHDPEMTRAAFEFSSEVEASPEGEVRARAVLKNVGAGHMAPTYVTPRIEITFQQIDAAGEPVGDRSEATIIQRQVVLGSHEISDTRLAQDESITASWTAKRELAAVAVRATVRCIPDQFYEELYKRLLARYPKGQKPHELISTALREAEARRFDVFRNEMTLR